MGIGHRDDADAGPAGVAQHDRLGTVGAQRPAQQAVLADLRSQSRRVVAELADFRRCLVHERQPVARVARRTGTEQWIGEPAAVRTTDTGVKPCSVYEHLQPGRIPPTNFETVKCGQRHLDRPEPADGRRRRCAAPEPDHFPRHPQSVPAQGESVVGQLAQAGIDALDAGALVAGQHIARINGTVDIGDEFIHRRQGGLDVEHALGVGYQQADSGKRSQRLVDLVQHCAGGFKLIEGVVSVEGGTGAAPGRRCGEPVGSVVQPRDHRGRLQRNPVVAAADDGHNPAHISEGTEHLTASRPGEQPPAAGVGAA